jgi:hypothetical protein
MVGPRRFHNHFLEMDAPASSPAESVDFDRLIKLRSVLDELIGDAEDDESSSESAEPAVPNACADQPCPREGTYRYTATLRPATVFETQQAMYFCDQCWARETVSQCRACWKSIGQASDTQHLVTCVRGEGAVSVYDSDSGKMVCYNGLASFHNTCALVCNVCCRLTFNEGLATPIKGLVSDQRVCKECFRGDGDAVKSFLFRNSAIMTDVPCDLKRLTRPVTAGIRYAGTPRYLTAAQKRSQQEAQARRLLNDPKRARPDEMPTPRKLRASEIV